MIKKKIFTQRGEIGRKILQFIKGEGYTKSSFAKMIDVSRPTLNQIIEGKTPSETTFNTQINKILNAIGMDLDDLINYENKNNNNTDIMKVAYSNNSPNDHSMSKSAVDTLNILDNVLDLYEIYYK